MNKTKCDSTDTDFLEISLLKNKGKLNVLNHIITNHGIREIVIAVLTPPGVLFLRNMLFNFIAGF